MSTTRKQLASPKFFKKSQHPRIFPADKPTRRKKEPKHPVTKKKEMNWLRSKSKTLIQCRTNKHELSQTDSLHDVSLCIPVLKKLRGNAVNFPIRKTPIKKIMCCFICSIIYKANISLNDLKMFRTFPSKTLLKGREMS